MQDLPSTGVAALILTCAMACARPAVDGGEASETAATEGSGDTTSADESSWGDGDGDGDGDDDPCGCDPGAICVADCVFGDFNPDTLENLHCIEDPACSEPNIHTPECIVIACESPFAEEELGCDPEQREGVDLICNYPNGPCDAISQDCPDGEKCVAKVPDADLLWTAYCVPIVGMDAVGQSCSSQGGSIDEGTDSCDGQSMCWNGAVSAEPFDDGTCQPFCDGSMNNACPDGMTCEMVTAGFQLCV
jgi:hypothetical protein